MNLVATAPKSSMSSEALGSDLSTGLALDRLNSLRSGRAGQPLLPILRSQYPAGCLLADLLQVFQEQFIVQAKVQVEGVTIATALGSASTVEVAEDLAKARVLEVLGLSTQSHAALSAAVSLLPEVHLSSDAPDEAPDDSCDDAQSAEASAESIAVAEVISTETVSTVSKATKAGSRRKSKAAAPEPEASILPEAIDIPETTGISEASVAQSEELPMAIVEPEPESAIEPVLESAIESIVEPVIEPTIEPVSELLVEPEIELEPIAAIEPAVLETVVDTAPTELSRSDSEVEAIEESFEVTFDSDDMAYEFSYEPEMTESFAPEAAPVANLTTANLPIAAMPTAAIPVTLPEVSAPMNAVVPMMPDFGVDLSDAIAQIGAEIERIGWTKKQGSAYLQQTYSKRTRAELTETELFAFLGYLKSLPAKVQPDLSALPF